MINQPVIAALTAVLLAFMAWITPQSAHSEVGKGVGAACVYQAASPR